jgi:crotonobetainyl-CoA:carnitine CoA-transferase CaiB-like acyl-CoA transferase
MLKHAFDGVKVLDLTSYIAGSFAATWLADLGADVVKVENPTGDPFRVTRGFLVWNRNKRGIVLDLKHPDGLAAFYRMVRQADVVMENYRPGVADRLGVGYERLREVNPRIIYCSVSGYGQTGPYSQKPAFDPLLQAIGGVMAGQGGPGNPPVFLRIAVSDYYAAALAAYGVASALYVREKTGLGQRVETSLLNAVIAIQAWPFLRLEDDPEPFRPGSGLVPYQLFQTADGWIFIACGNDGFWRNLCRALDIEAFAGDPRFATQPARYQNREELLGILQDILLTRTTAEWVELLEAHDVPVAPVQGIEALFDDPQVRHNEMVVELQHPKLGRIRQMGIPVRLGATPGEVVRPAPMLGQQTEEVLREYGFGPEEIAELRLKGITEPRPQPGYV